MGKELTEGLGGRLLLGAEGRWTPLVVTRNWKTVASSSLPIH